jgi:NitT/TauT family transport system substrate-binding protein
MVTRRWIIAAGALPLVLPVAPARAQQDKVRLGIISALFDAGSLIALERGYMRDQGIDVEVRTFPSSADANQALSIGAIDVLGNSISVAMFNAKLRDIEMSIVAGAGNNTKGHSTICLVIRKDLVDSGRYKGPADLKGMKLATGITSPVHWLPAMLANDAGVGEKSVSFVGLGIANAVAAMNNKAIDGGSVNEPYATLLVDKGDGVRVATIDQFYPNFPAGYLIYGSKLTKENVDLGDRYMVAYLQGMHDFKMAFESEKQSTDEIIGILRKYNIMVTADTPMPNIPDDGAPSFAGVDAYLDWQMKSGNIRSKVDIGSLVDDRFRSYAISHLQGGH